MKKGRESQFKKAIKKYVLTFHNKDLEDEFQTQLHKKFAKYMKYVFLIALILFIVFYPLFINSYLKEKDDDKVKKTTKETNKSSLICLPLFLVTLFIEMIVANCFPIFRRFRLFFFSLSMNVSTILLLSIYEDSFGSSFLLYYDLLLRLVYGHFGYYDYISGFVFNLITSVIQLAILFILDISFNVVYVSTLFLLFWLALIFILYFTEKTRKTYFFANKTLQKREKDLGSLLDHLPVGIFIKTNEETKYKNKAVAELFPSHQLSTNPEVDTFTVNDMNALEYNNDAISHFLDKIKDIDDLAYINYKGISGEGKEQKFEIRRIEKIEFEGEESSVIVVKDISQFEELQVEKIKQKYKDMFVLSLSHELRTPLNGIIGVSEAMEEDKLTEEERKLCARQITNSGYLLTHLIDSVQDLSKIESDTFVLHNGSMNPSIVLERCLNCIKSEFVRKNLNVETNKGVEIPNEIFIDQNRYSQVLLSLLLNAAKYTYQGDVKITLKYDYLEKLLWTTIEDTGIGIDENFFPYMFSLYGKLKSGNALHTTLSSPIEGIGLGLTMSKQIIKRMGGSIRISSIQGAGTKIRFSVHDESTELAHMPSEVESSYREIESIMTDEMKELEEIDIHLESKTMTIVRENIWPSATLVEENSLPRSVEMSDIPVNIPQIDTKRRPHILMVDDSGFNLFSLQLLLKQFNVTTQEARNGMEAIEKAETNQASIDRGDLDTPPIDLIYMDCNMPIMNGYRATEELRRRMREGKMRHIPIVALTAYDDENNRLLCINAGMDDVLFKPLNMEKLKNSLLQFHII